MGGDLKKLFWVGVAVVIIGIFTVSVVNPTYGKTKALKSAIEGIDYSDSTTP